jgi:hypothetical protein
VSGLYDPGEVALVEALRREFGAGSFTRLLHENQDARPVKAPDGKWVFRIGEVTTWLDFRGRVCFSAEYGGALHTGMVQRGRFVWDEPIPLAPPRWN